MTNAPPAAAPLPSRRQRPRSPARVLEEAEEQWLFTEEELSATPSIRDGMSQDVECDRRAKGVVFIRQVGIMLKLPELTLSVAALFLHRYCMRHSLQSTKTSKAIHHYTLGATCLFLATKVEECCRKMKELVVACCRVAQKNPNLTVDEQSKDFWKWRDTVLTNEDVLLEALCFDLTVEPPHKQLYAMLKMYKLEHNKRLRNDAWAFVTDSLITELCCLCSSRTIATAALYAAARLCGVQIPDDERGRPWWEAQRVGVKNMIRAANFMAKMYEHGPPGEGIKGSGAGTGADPGSVTTGTSAEGSQSIYVSLLADIESESARSEDQDPVWDRTRLKSAQAIPTPPPPVLVEEGPTARADAAASATARAASDSQGGQKRGWEGAAASETDRKKEEDTKRRKTNGSELDGGAPAKHEPVAESGPEPTPRAELSEEGEVEE